MRSKLKDIAINKNTNNKRYYRHIKYTEVPLNVSDQYIITKDGDRFDLLAHRFYNDKSLWWVIPSANPGIIKGDSFAVKAGIQIRIPNNPSLIVMSFQKLNSD